MFKRFYIFLTISSFIGAFIFSFSISSTTSYYYPIKNNVKISSPYGNRQIFGKYSFHNGIDIPAIVGTPVHSINNGVIKHIGFDANGYGNYIIILHQNSFKSLYAHLDDVTLVKLGDYITVNQVISFVGPKVLISGKMNGSTTGPHLHFTVFNDSGRTINPLTLEYKKE